jgi:MFS family permease
MSISKNGKKFIISSAIATVFAAAVNIYSPFLAPYLIENGFNKENIAFLFAISPFILIFLASIIGRLSDKLGRRKMVNYCLLFQVVAVLFYFFIKNDGIFFLVSAIILSTLGDNGYSITVFRKIESKIIKNRGLMTGIFQSLQSVGSLAGPIIGTFVVSFLPLDFIFKIPLVIFIIIFFLNNLPQAHPPHQPLDGKDFNFIKNIKKFWAIKELRGIAFLGMAVNFCGSARMVFIPLHITEDLGGNLRDVGILASIWGFFQLFQFLAGKFCDSKNGERGIKMTIYLPLLYAFLLITIFFAGSIKSIFLIMALIGLFNGFWNTSAWWYMTTIGAKNQEIGNVIGSYSSIATVGYLTSYLTSGIIIGYFDLKYLFIIYGLVVLAGVFYSKKYFPKNLEEAKVL